MAKKLCEFYSLQVVEPEFLKSGGVDIEDLLNEIGQYVGPIDEEETDEELASINRQWEREEIPLPPIQDESILESEPPKLFEEIPQVSQARGQPEGIFPEEEAPQLEEVPQLEEEPLQLEEIAPQLEEEALKERESPSLEEVAFDYFQIQNEIISSRK